MTFSLSYRAAAVALLLAGGAVLHGCASHSETSQAAQAAQAAHVPQAAPDAPQPPNVLAQVAAGVYQARLDNGLTLIVKPDRRDEASMTMARPACRACELPNSTISLYFFEISLKWLATG